MEDKKYSIQFSVKDTGIGMSTEILSKLFIPFSQADVSSTRKYGGTGLGLSICKSYIELMGGNINVMSEEGKGSSFIFLINLEESCSLIETNVNVNEENNDLQNIFDHKLKVLLVDDNEVNRALLIMLLNMNDIKCDVAVNGEEAVNTFLNKKYDLVLMDCQMPIMNGYEATRKMREIESESEHTVIIALTASAMKGDIEKCLEAGMDDYLSKPVNINQLTSMIQKYSKTETNVINFNFQNNINKNIC
jgi:CheY-like chemotaxis protein